MDRLVDKTAALVSGPRQQSWLSLLVQLVEFGTEGYPPKTRRRLKILNAMAYLIVVFSALYALTYALEGAWIYRWAIAINLALVLVGLAVPASHRLHETAGGLLIAASECAALFALVALLGRRSGIQLNLIVGASAPFVCFGLNRLRMVIGLVGLTFILHVAAWFLFPTGVSGLEPDPAFLGQLYLSSAITAFSVTAVLVYYAFNLAERAEAETEALLRNILPESVVERLKVRPGEAVADHHAEASVLFSDLRGFVPLSKALGAAGTVAMLNDLVHGFDRLAAKHGIEKIKTIGDAYMAVGGLPQPAPRPAAPPPPMALHKR